jgi:hypothetical protein
MKCSCCGNDAAGMMAMPDMEGKVYYDWIGQQVGSCTWCHELIYKLNEDADWLHLSSDTRRCNADEV